MLSGYRQRAEKSPSDKISDRKWQRRRQPAPLLFVRNLVSRARACEDLIFRSSYRQSGAPRKPGIIGQPPNQRGRVEQQPHGLSACGSEIPIASVYLPSAASRSSGSIGSRNTSLGIFQSRKSPGLRCARSLTGTSRARGFPARAITISSPATARSSNDDNLAFASAILI